MGIRSRFHILSSGGRVSSASMTIAVGLATAMAACTTDATVSEAADAGDSDGASEEEHIACPASGVTKGPWSLAMTRTTTKLRWEACREDADRGVVVKLEAGGAETRTESAVARVELKERYASVNVNAPPDLPGTYFMHEAALTGLEPGKCYRYELAADRTRGGRFCTAQPDGAKVHFLAIADTNPLLGDATSRVLSKLLPLGPDFTVHAGDIQYYDSGLETWAGWFPVMQPLLSSGALMAAIGNHELERDEEFGGYTLRFFGDESMGGKDAHYEFESGGVHFFALNTEDAIAPETPQGIWLVSRLAEVKKSPGFRTSIIFLHKPLVTCGDTYQDDAARNRYAPIFVQNSAPLVIQGHMHGYERFDLDGITYVTTGGGGGKIDNVDQNVSRAECASRKTSGAFFHGVDFVVDGSEIRAQVIDDSGLVRDSFAVPIR